MNDLLADPAFSDPGWDKGIYPAPGKERLLAVVGGIKGNDGDSRVLQPLEGELSRPFSDFLIHSLQGDESAFEPRPAARRAKRSRTAQPDQDEREVAACQGKDRLLPLTEQRMIQLAADAMKASILKGFRLHRVSGNSVQFVCDGVRSCAYAEMHRGNGCFRNFMLDGIVYNCTSAQAQHKPMKIGEWEADPKAIDLDGLPSEALCAYDS
ncbi:g8151 [Coccomyxa viridis]|uniref:G8151 protein n=1 Tax=Coccomyxa viridis TaxID=1274662 RepID=A0ABP1FZS8_9CHLO